MSLYSLDVRLFYLINKDWSNAVFNFLMPLVSAAAGGEGLCAAALIMLFLKKRELKVLGILLIAGLTLSYQFSEGIKNIVHSPRPFLILPDVNLIEKVNGYSFPSTHATQAFTAASILSASLKRHIVFFSLAVFVAVSRVYMGVHFPLDVIFGALLGIAIGCGLVAVCESAAIPFKSAK